MRSSPENASPPPAALRSRLAREGQEHLLRFWDRLPGAAREHLEAQIQALDVEPLMAAVRAALAAPERPPLAAPPPVDRVPELGGDPALAARARSLGEAALAAGEVASLLVAGGQGTRLGLDGPKGSLRLGPVSRRSLFEQQAQKLRRAAARAGRPIPWLVMTSHATHEATTALFVEQRYFGLEPAQVQLFEQPSLPAVDAAGRLLLEAPDRLALSPGGHGNVLPALVDSGVLDAMEARGVRWITYGHVDNPLLRLADPLFLGLHVLRRAEMSLKVVRKKSADEKAGTLARLEGRTAVVEYTEVPRAERDARGPDGELAWWAASIGMHVLDVGFVRRVAAEADRLLPYHASPKAIPCVDDAGNRVEPASPNGYKLERFVFDALPAARRVAALEVERGAEYAPIKNAAGSESPQSARQALVACYRRWLAAADVPLPPEPVFIEIDQSRIDGPEDVRSCGIRDLREAGDLICIAAE